MAKVNVNIRLDQVLKDSASQLAQEMGTNLSTVINMYLVKFTREKKIEIGIDENIKNYEFVFDKPEKASNLLKSF